MPTLLNPAQSWLAPLSEYVILWHGCTSVDKSHIEQLGIQLNHCAVDSDFGRGFYTTTLERQARQWAWTYYSWLSQNPGKTGNQPVVLRFQARRYSSTTRVDAADAGLDALNSLQFVIADYFAEDYWSFVQHCRQSTKTHINDHQRTPGGWYDLVCGPVAAFWKQRVSMVGSEQFSFHTDRAIGILNGLVNREKKTKCKALWPTKLLVASSPMRGVLP
jgi:hypothetical protein